MKKYVVIFTQCHAYEVEADNYDMAFEKGYEEFDEDMHYPVANTMYDDVEVTCLDDDDEEEE